MDRLLVERARAGDRDAFGELMERRLEGAYRMALDILGRPADARDATQETFIAVWRGLPSLREPARFDAWFNRILLNSCRMALRRHRRVREITFSSAADIEQAHRSSDPSEPAAAFDEAFERLSVEQRAIIVAHHLEGQAVADIAARLGIPVGTVKSRLHTARRALRAALEIDA